MPVTAVRNGSLGSRFTKWAGREGWWCLAALVLMAAGGWTAITQSYCAVAFTLAGLVRVGLLGAAPFVVRRFLAFKLRIWKIAAGLAVVLLLASAGLVVRYHERYRTGMELQIPIQEYSNAEYPEDPASRSIHFGKYHGRELLLIRKDQTHFDFVFEPQHAHLAKVVFHDVDVRLMTPSVPAWTKNDSRLVRIALTDRQWNRQQVSFSKQLHHLAVTGGDGFEEQRLYSAELAKNCLNAGLWELLLFVEEDGQKSLYYQGWFTFPLGLYAELFEHNTGLPYREHWHYLEHWRDPAGTVVALHKLRTVVSERSVKADFNPGEQVVAAGEQVRKRRTVLATNVVHWQDFFDGRPVSFATFVPPGRYAVDQPRPNEFCRLDQFDHATWREIQSPIIGGVAHLAELELTFINRRTQEPCRFIVSGFDPGKLPKLPIAEYSKGMYMPMGIGVPPFFQSYDELERHPPQYSPYVSVMLDQQGRWIDHHAVAVDGPVLHRDAVDPGLIHVYLLSYERHSLLMHVVVDLTGR